jgi:MFS family permease
VSCSRLFSRPILDLFRFSGPCGRTASVPAPGNLLNSEDPSVRSNATGLWRNPDFLKLWTGQTVSVFGSLITWTALQFTAILVLDATAFQVALLSAATPIAGILVGLVAGVWVDRLHRRPLMIVADLLRAVFLVSIPLAALLDALRIEQLYLVAVLTGMLTIVFDVSYQSYLPTLVRHDELLEGNSKLTASASAAEVGSFGVSGWLIQVFTAPFTVLVDALTFLVSALCLLLIRSPEPPPPPPDERESVRQEIAEGLRLVMGNRILRALTGSAVMEALGRGFIGSVVLLYLSRDLGFSPGVLGMVFGVGGLSSLGGAMLAERATRRFGVGPAMIGSLLIASLGTLCLPLARDASLVALGLLVANQLITDPASTVNDIASISLRQSHTPPRVLGRVNASIRFCGLAVTLLGTLAAGLLAERAGLRVTLLVGIGCNLLAVVWLVMSPVRGIVRLAEVRVASPSPDALPRVR